MRENDIVHKTELLQQLPDSISDCLCELLVILSLMHWPDQGCRSTIGCRKANRAYELTRALCSYLCETANNYRLSVIDSTCRSISELAMTISVNGRCIAKRRPPFLLPLLMALLVLHIGAPKPASALLYDYYLFTCPNLESIVKSTLEIAYASDSRIVASILRLHFHDCFVDGCDASVLLKNTPTFTGEQSAVPNINSIRGFNVIDDIKAAVEAECPETVSCADILALAARDGIIIAQGPYYPVPLGRYDSISASEADANNGIPAPFLNFTSLSASFSNVGLDETDLVALSGAHTFGKARCTEVNFPGNSRLYNWSQNSDLTSGTGKPDPHMNSGFLAQIQANCPQGGDGNALNNLDLQTDLVFDNAYYQNLVASKGLLNSDQALWYQSTSAEQLVTLYADDEFSWFLAFVISVTKMGYISPKTADNGEIRVDCGFPNS